MSTIRERGRGLLSLATALAVVLMLVVSPTATSKEQTTACKAGYPEGCYNIPARCDRWSWIARHQPQQVKPEIRRCWGGMIIMHSWPFGWVVNTMACESGGDPDATNGPHRSLMQVVHGPSGPRNNMAAAWSIYQRGGKKRWPLCGRTAYD